MRTKRRKIKDKPLTRTLTSNAHVGAPVWISGASVRPSLRRFAPVCHFWGRRKTGSWPIFPLSLLLRMKYETWSSSAKSSPPGSQFLQRQRCSALPGSIWLFWAKPVLTLWQENSIPFWTNQPSHHLTLSLSHWHDSDLFFFQSRFFCFFVFCWAVSCSLHVDSWIVKADNQRTFLFLIVYVETNRLSTGELSAEIRRRGAFFLPASYLLFSHFFKLSPGQKKPDVFSLSLILPPHPPVKEYSWRYRDDGEVFGEHASRSGFARIIFAFFSARKRRVGAAGRRGGGEFLSGRVWPLLCAG